MDAEFQHKCSSRVEAEGSIPAEVVIPRDNSGNPAEVVNKPSPAVSLRLSIKAALGHSESSWGKWKALSYIYVEILREQLFHYTSASIMEKLLTQNFNN
jgi:hypothetical protein